MKGTDVPQAEIENAENFLKASHNWPIPERFIHTREQFIRILAWYGAIRSNGDHSGHFVVNSHKQDALVPSPGALRGEDFKETSAGTSETGGRRDATSALQSWALVSQRLDEWNLRHGRLRKQEALL